MAIELASQGAEVMRQGIVVRRVQLCGPRDIEVMELALAKEFNLLELLRVIQCIEVGRQFGSLQRLGDNVTVVLESIGYPTLQKERKDGTMLPVDQTGNFKIVGDEDVIELQIRVSDGWTRAVRVMRDEI